MHDSELISPHDIPHHEFFVQWAATGSKRFPLKTLPDGTTVHRLDLPERQWVNYSEVDLWNLTFEPEKITSLSKLLKRKIEDPRFLLYSEQMPYTQENFEELLRRPGAMLMLAWEGKPDRTVENASTTQYERWGEPMGYSYSAPYDLGDIVESIDYIPDGLKIFPDIGKKGIATADIVRINDDVVRLTRDNTWVHDSFAAFKGIGAGTMFQNRMLERIFLMAGQRTKLLTFAVTGAYTESMLDRSLLLKKGRVLKCNVPYRGTTATTMINDLELRPIGPNELF